MADYCFHIITMLWIAHSGSQVIGEHAGWATEDVIFQCNTFIYRYVVLNLYAVADGDIIGYVDILAQATV